MTDLCGTEITVAVQDRQNEGMLVTELLSSNQ